MARATKHSDFGSMRDRSDEAGRFLYQAIVAPGRMDLEGPLLTSHQVDMEWKADWKFVRKPVHEFAPRPPGVLYCGSRFLGQRGRDDYYVGRYLIISGKEDRRGNTEYAVWKHGASTPASPFGLPEYGFYLTAWTDGEGGPVLEWAVADMMDWAAKKHQLVNGDCYIEYRKDKARWDAANAIPCDLKVPPHGRPFYRFPIAALKTYGEW